MINGKKVTAIVLAGGKGSRMGGKVSKQYLPLKGRPVLYYTLKAFEDSIVDNIILVVGHEEEKYCRESIIQEYNMQKVEKIVEGGKERYNSVYCGLKAIKTTDIVLIHDGARAFVTADIIERSARGAEKYRACVVGVKAKDTIKIATNDDYIEETPDRNKVWQVQTPQAFDYAGIMEAYEEVLKQKKENITDDAMIWESHFDTPIKLIDGSYTNLKITTPEDMRYGEVILEMMNSIKEA